MTSKVLALLDAFSPTSPALTLSELARRAELPLSTVYRRAAELVEWGRWSAATTGGTGWACGCGRWVRSLRGAWGCGNWPFR
ncbi:hypothetical protein GCM10027605_29990 [Micromonospora zhanjiangensis]